MRRYVLPMLLLVALATWLGVRSAPAEAAVDSATQILAGAPSLVVTVDADGATHAAVDSGTFAGAGKVAAVVTGTVNGQEFLIHVRYQHASNGVFLDLVVDDTITDLGTRLDAMDLSATVPAHPSPTKDTADTEAYTSAGGS